MMRKERNLRLAVSGILLLAVVAAGIGACTGRTRKETQNRIRRLERGTGRGDASYQMKKLRKMRKQKVQMLTLQCRAQMEGTEDEGTAENTETAEDASAQDETAADETAAQDVQEVLPSLDFNDNTVMEWPVSGDVLIDYSMDGAVYFPTLEVYKYNPAVILECSG